MARPSKKKLPRYVIIQNGDWHVRRAFPSKERDTTGRLKYIQIKQRCIPATADRAAEVSQLIEAAYYDALVESEKPQTVAEFLSHFIEAKRSSLSKNTHGQHRQLLDFHIAKTEFVKLAVAELRPIDVQNFYTELASRGTTPFMVRKIHKFISSAFNQGIRWESLIRNPAKGALLPKWETREIRFLTMAEARTFISACRTNPAWFVFEFALETGMRPGEYLALTWSDIDLEKHTVKVSKAIARDFGGKGYEIKEPKTKGSKRTIELSSNLTDRLREHKAQQQIHIESLKTRETKPVLLKHLRARGANYAKRSKTRANAKAIIQSLEKYDLLFPDSKGSPASRVNLAGREFAEALTAAGLKSKEFSLYSLRHSCATLMLSVGVNIKTVADKLGHSDAAVLLRTYAHVLPSMREESTKKLAAALY